MTQGFGAELWERLATDHLLKMRPSLQELTEIEERRAERPVGHHEEQRVVRALGQQKKLLAYVPRCRVVRAQQVEPPQPVKHGEDAVGLPDTLAQLSRPAI